MVFRPTEDSFPRLSRTLQPATNCLFPHSAHFSPLPIFRFIIHCGICRHFNIILLNLRRKQLRVVPTSPHFAQIRFHVFTRFPPQSKPVSPFFVVSFPFAPLPVPVSSFLPSITGFPPTSALSVLVLAIDPAFYSPLRSTCHSPLSHPAPQDHLFLEKHFTFEKRCAILHKHLNKHLPVAQLDSASDSDSEGRRFESCRVGQKGASPPCVGAPLFALPSGRTCRRACAASRSSLPANSQASRLRLGLRIGACAVLSPASTIRLTPPTQGGSALVCSTAPARTCGNFVACDGIA